MNINRNRIKKVFIANRAEIARRIQTACHTNNIQTVSVYTQEDQKSPYVYNATESYKLSKDGCDGYLNQDELINIAKKSNADAVHPGYGFHSENYVFAQKVIDAGLTWIGPDPQSIQLMGNKIEARKKMILVNVPVIPGEHFTANEGARAEQKALEIGYPVILKSALGGGGKAMRKIDSENQFKELWNSVVSESKNMFHSEEIILEKYISHGRHIEVQIAGDGENFIHLYERECSIQRRQQKIIEETPCKFLSAQTKEKLYEAAIKAAKSAQYKNLGTVEFIVTPDEQFYFLEMNTRLQVEHAVTEISTGIDLVSLQLAIAERKKLPLTQKHVTQTRHAIECRVYAEDPKHNFVPSSGKITVLQLPHEPFLRIDHDLEEQMEVSPFFDPMIAKVITSGNSRAKAIVNMHNALQSVSIVGIKTNTDFLKNIIRSETFALGKFDTQTLKDQNAIDAFITKKQPVLHTDDIKIIAATVISENLGSSESKKRTSSNWRTQQWR